MHHIQVLSNQRHLHKPSAFGHQEKPPCFVMCAHVTSHNSRLWVHPARLHKQSASQSQDVVTAAIWQCLMLESTVLVQGLGGRWKAEISHATMYCGHTYNTLHPPGSLSRPNERHGCDPTQTGRNTSTPGSCLTPSGLLSLPMETRVYNSIHVYACVCPCPRGENITKAPACCN